MKIFGTSEVSIRTLTFLFFLGTVFFVYLIGKKLWDQKSGLLAALLTVGNPFLFKYAFEGRMYALLALTTTASMYFYLKKHRLGHILSTVAALYTHHFSIFGISVQVLWHLKGSRGRSLKKLIAHFRDFFIIGFLYLPWFYPLYYQTSLVGSGFWLAKPSLNAAKEVIETFIFGATAKDILKKPLFGQGLINWQALSLALLPVLIFSRRWLKENKKTLFLLLWFFLPLALTFTVSWFFQSIFFDRYMLFVIPGLLLVLASNRRQASNFALISLIGTMLMINFLYFTHPTKRPFRELAILVKDKIDNNDFLINYNAAAHHLFESKYYGLKAPLYVPEGELPFYVGTALMEKKDVIKKIPPDVVRLGVITSGSLKEVKIPGYKILASFEVGGLKFARFVPYQ